MRALDTRIDETPLTKGNVRIVPIAGLYGVPSSATAVSVNVTAVNAQGPAFVKVFPCGQAVPVASNGNTSPDRIVASQAVVPVGVLAGRSASWPTGPPTSSSTFKAGGYRPPTRLIRDARLPNQAEAAEPATVSHPDRGFAGRVVT